MNLFELVLNFLLSLNMIFKNYNMFRDTIQTEEAAYQFAVNNNLIKFERVCDCNAVLNIEKDSSQKYGIRFRCSNSRRICRKSFSILHGSWFASSKVSIRDQLSILYCYCLHLKSFQISLQINTRDLSDLQ